MKLLIVLLLICSVSSASNSYRLFMTCANPRLLEGELSIYVADDNSTSYVSESGIAKYPAQIQTNGPVNTFDYVANGQRERIIVAVDGQHELHKWSKGKFQKVGDLTCY